MHLREEVYNTYWYFAAERQNIFFNKINHDPLTSDPLFLKYKFCNAYRASDRVSQFLIKNVIYGRRTTEQDMLFRIVFFRLLNSYSTWRLLEQKLGDSISLKNFDTAVYDQLLNEVKAEQGNIYGNAFILCAAKSYGYEKKQQNQLALLKEICISRPSCTSMLLSSKTIEELYENLKTLPLIGTFMGYQLAIDLNYSDLFQFNENDFTVAGPGAKRGIAKCFTDTGGKSDAYMIHFMVDIQDEAFLKLGLKFKNLWGRKLHAIDCQGLFCETDKYSRVAYPALKSNRVKIKSVYKGVKEQIDYFYPPKWKLNVI